VFVALATIQVVVCCSGDSFGGGSVATATILEGGCSRFLLAATLLLF
jgi:hypothetical protein